MSEPIHPTTDLHTPTPWKERAPSIDGEVDETYRQITAGCGYFPEADEPELSGFKLTGFIKPADARLIVAAPDLLGALKELLASQLAPYPPFESGKDAQNAWSDRRAKACTDAEAVIAKAEGRGNV